MHGNFIKVILAAGLIAGCSRDIPDAPAKVEKSLFKFTPVEGEPTWNLHERMEVHGVKGVSMAVVKDMKIVWTRHYGVLSGGKEAELSDKTPFPAGLASEAVASYTAYVLMKKGLFTLDDPVDSLLGFKRGTIGEETPVTVRHLLSHRSGFGESALAGQSPDSLAAAVRADAIRQLRKAGDVYMASDANFYLLQKIIEKRTGKAFRDVARELVLKPLKLKCSSVGAAGKETNKHLEAGSGLQTTPADYSRFMIDLMLSTKGRSEKILEKDDLKGLVTPAGEQPYSTAGLRVYHNQLTSYIRYESAADGFAVISAFTPELGYGAVVMADAGNLDFVREVMNSIAFVYDWEDYFPYADYYLNYYEAARTGDLEKVKHIHPKIKVARTDDRGNTGLMLAALSGHYKVADWLAKKPEDYLRLNKSGQPLSVQAVVSGDTDLLSYLIGRKVDMSSGDKYGFTAFDWAYALDRQEALKILNPGSGRRPERIPAFLRDLYSFEVTRGILEHRDDWYVLDADAYSICSARKKLPVPFRKYARIRGYTRNTTGTRGYGANRVGYFDFYQGEDLVAGAVSMLDHLLYFRGRGVAFKDRTVDMPDEKKPFHVDLLVNLETRKVTLVFDGKITIESELRPDFKQIDTYGFSTYGTVTAFKDVEISGE